MVEVNSNESGWVMDCFAACRKVSNRIRSKSTADTVCEKYPSLKICSSIYGFSQTGQPYNVYRFLLYCDNFESRSHLFPRGSIGGCCLSPLDILMSKRRGVTSIRTLSLTHVGISTNQVLDKDTFDIVVGTTSGLGVHDVYRRSSKVFLQCFLFVADYPSRS